MEPRKAISGKQIAIIAAVTVLLVAIVFGLNYIIKQKNADDDSPLNKDSALRELWEKSVFFAEYNDKKVVLTNKDDVFALLRSTDWIFSPNQEIQAETPDLKFEIEENYFILLYATGFAEVEYNSEKRLYETPTGLVGDLLLFIEDNTTIAIDDAVSFLSLSDNVTVEMLGLSYVATNGKKLASTFNISSWLPYEKDVPEEEPMISIDNKNGLKISFYDSLNIASIDYNGSKTFYTLDDMTIPGVALVVKSYFNELTKTISEAISNAKNLAAIKSDGEYMISSSSTLLSLLDFTKWERRYKEPAAMPETADIIIKDDAALSLLLYKERNIAAFDNAYFTIPETVISALEDYLAKDEQESPAVELRSELSTLLSSKKTVDVTHNNKNYIMTVKQDLISTLKISSWTEDSSLTVKDAPTMVIYIEGSQFSLNFHESSSVVVLIKNNTNQIFKIAETIIPALVLYMQENLYTEQWAISATELGSLQKTAESVEITITAADGTKDKYTGDVKDPIAILAALNLVALESKPKTLAAEKTEIIFRGENRFTMTLYPNENDGITVNVVGTFYGMGKHTDRWFETKTEKYKTVAESLKTLNYKAYDTAAARFSEAFKTGDIDTINALIGSTTFSYESIKDLMINDMTFEKMSTPGHYKVVLNIEEPNDAPFKKGTHEYILILGTQNGVAVVKTFALMTQYNIFSKPSDAVMAVDDFTTWAEVAGMTFNSLSDLQNKGSVAGYLMQLLYKEGKGTPSPENTSVILFTQAELNEAAKKYFGVDSYDARETSVYNSTTDTYRYEGRSVPIKYKRVSALIYDNTTATYKVTYEWYSDPLCLFLTNSVIYTLSKSETGVYIIHSAEEIPSQEANPTEEIPTDIIPQEPTEPQKTEEPKEEAAEETTEEQSENEEPTENEPTEEETEDDKFVPPSELSPTETVFKYFEYLNEKSSEKTESLLFSDLRGSNGDYSFDTLKKITVLSCVQIPADFEWYEPWYKNPFAYTCIAVTFKVDCEGEKYLNYMYGENVYEFYLIKESETSDWRIISLCISGEGLLN